MNISIILATYDRPGLLFQTLESFCKLKIQGLKWEVIVADNLGDQKTQQTISEFHDKLPVKAIIEERRGKNNAINKAIEIARGDLFVFTDDDIVADPYWLTEIWEGTQRWPDYSIFGGRILPLFPPGKVPLSSEHPFFSGAYVVADRNIAEGPFNSQDVWGPNMAIRSKIFHDGWRYNPDIGPNVDHGATYIMGSETELMLRLEKAGMGAVFLPKSLVYHQIRPEQLEIAWLYRRAFRAGRYQVLLFENPDVAYLFGAPRHLYRKIFTLSLKRIRYCFDTDKRIDLGIKYWMLRGNVHQHRISINNVDPAKERLFNTPRSIPDAADAGSA